MDPDTSMVIGMAVGVLSIPAIVSAFADGRTPRAAAVSLVIAGGLMVYAINTKDGGYQVRDLPRVIYGVIGDII
ncbi:hypothetical protein [Thalassococcus lentus]|uniref:50S ribosomal protein L35 n=1 Tax=Thalassococcus lentus TaxID=1210524 RepID=A0ABT4XTA7_9RHOB|nr:hypothetical protein [Thalassococcus lentus]MDA7425170.1 hypothetical protein [Thalassococcus lentus]